MKLLERTLERPEPSAPVGAAIEEITPQYAKRLLAKNKVNRRLDEKVASRYARDMLAGKWLLTGEGICIDTAGDLRQGQHRLRACVIANSSFTTLVVRGIEPSAQLAMDSGKKRSLGDQLRLLGEKNTSDLSTVIGMCFRYDQNALTSNTLTPSRSEALAWLQDNGSVRDSIVVGRRVGSHIPLARNVASFGHYLIWRVDAVDADSFFERLVSGTDLQDGNPILALRRWMDRWAGKRDQPASIVHAHALLKCCNYWRSGQSLKFVKVLAGEPFPKVWGEPS